MDWRTVGYEDGAAGYSGDRIGQHRKACAKYGVTPNLAEYQQGRTSGLREYCVPANGFRIGSHGGSYNGLCPEDLEGAFLESFESGQHLYTLQARVQNTANRLYSDRQELEQAEQDIVTKSALAISGDATSEQRAQAVVDVKHLAERVGRLKQEIRQLESDQIVYQRDLDDYQETLRVSR
ncbi:MAG TPA: DUF2799 domain-containing protein [Steroidobacteraceae bacterium]|nr:DUF2799 domain-containing protein [Steroidobacteraceae bacterium]